MTEDFGSLIDCGDAGPTYNQIIKDLYTPFGVTYEELEQTFKESMKKYADIKIERRKRSLFDDGPF